MVEDNKKLENMKALENLIFNDISNADDFSENTFKEMVSQAMKII